MKFLLFRKEEKNFQAGSLKQPILLLLKLKKENEYTREKLDDLERANEELRDYVLVNKSHPEKKEILDEELGILDLKSLHLIMECDPCDKIIGCSHNLDIHKNFHTSKEFLQICFEI